MQVLIHIHKMIAYTCIISLILIKHNLFRIRLGIVIRSIKAVNMYLNIPSIAVDYNFFTVIVFLRENAAEVDFLLGYFTRGVYDEVGAILVDRWKLDEVGGLVVVMLEYLTFFVGLTVVWTVEEIVVPVFNN